MSTEPGQTFRTHSLLIASTSHIYTRTHARTVALVKSMTHPWLTNIPNGYPPRVACGDKPQRTWRKSHNQRQQPMQITPAAPKTNVLVEHSTVSSACKRNCCGNTRTRSFPCHSTRHYTHRVRAGDACAHKGGNRCCEGWPLRTNPSWELWDVPKQHGAAGRSRQQQTGPMRR